jgi:hypothetical protein
VLEGATHFLMRQYVLIGELAESADGVGRPPLTRRGFPSRKGRGGPLSIHPIEMRRGWASFAFGRVRVSTPSSSCALIRSWSILSDNVNDRV